MARTLPALAGLLLAAHLVAADSHIFHAAREGRTKEATGWAISGGSCYARHRSPGVTFGTVRLPSGKRQFTYVVLSQRDGSSLNLNSGHCDLEVNAGEAADRSTIEAGGQKLSLVYKVRINSGGVVSESLTVDGKEVDLRAGRVLVVRFSKDMTWTQAKASLPAPTEDAGKPGAVQETGMKLLEQLRENPAVRAFFK